MMGKIPIWGVKIMPAKKKAKKSTTVEKETRLIAIQGILLAVIAGVVLFGILKMVQLRDNVDALLMQQLAAPQVQTLPVMPESE
ncbi:hypothetical protein A2W24_07010 [Microgenomates group bacterium RBG_16_45_19]|nr:MAG: hypothetical protein A2W24_07010 [Microgenomates group bacterium RBG_16_45_19]